MPPPRKPVAVGYCCFGPGQESTVGSEASPSGGLATVGGFVGRGSDTVLLESAGSATEGQPEGAGSSSSPVATAAIGVSTNAPAAAIAAAHRATRARRTRSAFEVFIAGYFLSRAYSTEAWTTMAWLPTMPHGLAVGAASVFARPPGTIVAGLPSRVP